MKKLTACLMALALLFSCGCAKRTYSPVEPVAQWEENVKADPAEKIVLAWDMQPTGGEAKVPEGVTVMAPTWIYAEADEQGAPKITYVDGDFKNYVKSAKEQGAQVWVTVCSFTADVSRQLVTDENRRKTFCRAVNTFVRRNGLDGVCLDFERMDPANKEAYTQFVRYMADMLPADTVVSACVTVQLDNQENNWYQCYDHAGLASVCDYLCLMAYDQYYLTSESAGPVAGLDWTEEKLKRELIDVPSDRLILGMPFYYYAYPYRDGTPLWPDTNVSLFTWSVLEQIEKTGNYTDRHGDTITPQFSVDEIDEASGMRHMEFTDQYGIKRVCYADTPESLTARSSLTRIYHLKGAAVWKADHGTQAQWALLRRQINRNR